MAALIAEICLSSEPMLGLYEAEKWINKAIELNLSSGTIWILGKCYAVNSNFVKLRGDLPDARKMLNCTLKIFKEIGADGWVEKYEKELAALS